MVLLHFLILYGMMLGAVLVMWVRPSEYRMLSEQIQHIQDRLSRTSTSEQKGEVSAQPMPDAHVRSCGVWTINEPTIRKAPCNIHGSMTMRGSLDADTCTPFLGINPRIAFTLPTSAAKRGVNSHLW